ncbi:MAG: response regulator [Ferruginibacter sp.]
MNCILLIDDDDDCNFFHRRLLTKLNCAEHIEVAKNGIEALEFLRSVRNGNHDNPSIIFLDINMPKMNGWEFLEEYKKLSDQQKAKIVLIMLTTSLNPQDQERAKTYSDVDGFKNKYLDEESLDEILQKYFPEYL